LIIHVKTIGTIKSLEQGAKPFSLEVAQSTSVSQVIERLNIQDWEVGFVLINGNRTTKESFLRDQDELTLIAPLAGG
jgi:molybdopterin converting factor small subunit